MEEADSKGKEEEGRKWMMWRVWKGGRRGGKGNGTETWNGRKTRTWQWEGQWEERAREVRGEREGFEGR